MKQKVSLLLFILILHSSLYADSNIVGLSVSGADHAGLSGHIVSSLRERLGERWNVIVVRSSPESSPRIFIELTLDTGIENLGPIIQLRVSYEYRITAVRTGKALSIQSGIRKFTGRTPEEVLEKAGRFFGNKMGNVFSKKRKPEAANQPVRVRVSKPK